MKEPGRTVLGGLRTTSSAVRVARGYTEGQIAQIWSGNTLRVWREVEEVGRRLRNYIQRVILALTGLSIPS